MQNLKDSCLFRQSGIRRSLRVTEAIELGYEHRRALDGAAPFGGVKQSRL